MLRAPIRVANVSMPNFLSPSTSGRSLVMAITVANTVTKTVMNAIGGLQTAVLEHQESTVVLAAMSSDVVLLVIVKLDANLGALLYDIRRHRAGLATLV